MRVSNISFMILNRYFLKSIFSYTLAISLIFILIIVSSRSIQYLEQAARGEINPEIVFTIVLFRLPEFLELILPLGFFLSIILVIGKFRSESEFVIMEQSGFTLTKIYYLLSLPAAFICILLFYFALILNPNLTLKVNDLLNIKTLEDTYSSLTPGDFHKLRQNLLLYAESKDQEELNNIFVTIKDDDLSKETILVAKGLTLDNSSSGTLVFNEGLIYEKNIANNLSNIRFESFSLKSFSDREPNQSFVSMHVGQPISWALSLCVMIVVSLFIAVPLSKTSPRSGRYAKVFPGLLIFSIYSGLLLSIKGNEIEEMNSILYIHLIFMLVAIFLNFYSYGKSQ